MLSLGIKNRKRGGGGSVMAAAFMGTLAIANDGTTYNTGTAYELTGSELWSAISDLSTVIEDNNLASKIVCLHPWIGGTATYHKYNLIDPSLFEATFYGGMVHDGRGIVPNGTNAYVDCGITASDMVLDATGMNFYNRSNITENTQAMGMRDNITDLGLIQNGPRFSNNRRQVRVNSTAYSDIYVANALRNNWTQRISSTIVEMYQDKALLASRTAASTNIALRNFLYCCSSYTATANINYSTYNHALTMVIKGVFTTAEREALTDAITAFQVAMLRNV